MKLNIALLHLILLFGNHLNVKAQRPTDIPGYTPLVPRLMSLRFDENSNTMELEEIKKEKLNSSVLEEEINIYVNYEMDWNVAKDDRSLTNPPKKLMNFDLIYSYIYRIGCTSSNDLNQKLSEISLGKTDQLENMEVTCYFLKKSRVRANRIKNKNITIDTLSRRLSISIPEDSFESCLMIQLSIDIKSKDFGTLRPSFNTKGKFVRHLSISMPSIFEYDYPANKLGFELLSNKINPFRLLHFNRGVTHWDEIIEIFEIDSHTLRWKVNTDEVHLDDAKFKLQRLKIPVAKDIGFPKIEFYKPME